MKHIELIRAGAGSGKTHRLTELIEAAIRAGECRPGGLVATTFTTKAATELRERLRERLYGAGMFAEAGQLGQALVGTVHSLGRQLLERFALEAGISPQLDIMDQTAARSLLDRAAGEVISADEVGQLQALADRLAQVGGFPSYEYPWKRQVRDLIDMASANGFTAEEVRRFGRESADEFLALLGSPAKGSVVGKLQVAVRDLKAACEAWGDETGVTVKYVALLDTLLGNDAPAWNAWYHLAGADVAKRGRTDAVVQGLEAVQRLLGDLRRDPNLHADIRSYTETVFNIAADVMSHYAALKAERGWVDFSDLEKRVHDLITSNAAVKAQLKETMDLLVVDEFQDTSPLQLALFLQLAECAKRVVWVGDVKQAIYGFRNSDPELLGAVARALPRRGEGEILGHSWRTVPALVSLVNGLFTDAFDASLQLKADEVKLEAKRTALSDPSAPLTFLRLAGATDGKKPKGPEQVQALAAGVARLLSANPPARVFDKTLRQERDMTPGDVAVLCFRNNQADDLVAALGAQGVAVSRAGSGLLATPEAQLALACLRCLADPADTLAPAEVIALTTAESPEEWLADRLRYVRGKEKGQSDLWRQQGEAADVRLTRLVAARGGLGAMSVTEAMDVALRVGDVHAAVSAWGPERVSPAVRRANLEALRSLTAQYEQQAVSRHEAATLSGLVAWLNDREQNKEDPRASERGPGAVTVSTYHGAKGLEWPVVVCFELDRDREPSYFAPRVESPEGVAFDLENPLAGRRIRLWVSPFGGISKGVDALNDILASPQAEALRVRQAAEELRVLYVGLTRMRDRLILAVPWQDSEALPACLDTLGASWLAPRAGELALPDGTSVRVDVVESKPGEVSLTRRGEVIRRWFPEPVVRETVLPARVTPSSLPTGRVARVGRVVTVGERLEVKGRPDFSAVGDALHGILAAECACPGEAGSDAVAARLLTAYGVAEAVNPAAAAAMARRFHAWMVREWGVSGCAVEVPFHYRNPAGQGVAGFMDLVLDTPHGVVLVDHKSFPGPATLWEATAAEYFSQLGAYADAFAARGTPVAGVWIHFAVGGGLVEIVGL